MRNPRKTAYPEAHFVRTGQAAQSAFTPLSSEASTTGAVCGTRKGEETLGNVIEVNDATFEGEVLKAEMPVLVHFWAPACPPCAAMHPILTKLAGEFDGKIKFAKLNAAKERIMSAKYRIAAVPTLIIFKEGEIVNQVIGFQSEADLRRRIEALIAQKEALNK